MPASMLICVVGCLAQTTVREALLYSGRLRQPASVDWHTLSRFVDEVR